MKFAFLRRETTEKTVWVEAETEIDAWDAVLAGVEPDAATDPKLAREPVFRRTPELDGPEYDL